MHEHLRWPNLPTLILSLSQDPKGWRQHHPLASIRYISWTMKWLGHKSLIDGSWMSGCWDLCMSHIVSGTPRCDHPKMRVSAASEGTYFLFLLSGNRPRIKGKERSDGNWAISRTMKKKKSNALAHMLSHILGLKFLFLSLFLFWMSPRWWQHSVAARYSSLFSFTWPPE